MDAIIHHSFEGWFNSIAGDGYNVAEDPTRNPTGWHGTVCSRIIVHLGKAYPPGTLFQHYPVFARLQHANAANIVGPGFELEGTSAMLITDVQIETYKRIHADMRKFTGKSYERFPLGDLVGLIEHREVPNSQTACPSNRYTPLWTSIAMDAIQEAGEMDKETKDAIDALTAQVKAQNEIIFQHSTQLYGEGNTGKRDENHPYANATMFDVEQLMKILPMLARITVKNGPKISGQEVLKAIQDHDAAGHCLWQDHDDLNAAVRKLQGADAA
jgi:hypothetical protein